MTSISASMAWMRSTALHLLDEVALGGYDTLVTPARSKLSKQVNSRCYLTNKIGKSEGGSRNGRWGCGAGERGVGVVDLI